MTQHANHLSSIIPLGIANLNLTNKIKARVDLVGLVYRYPLCSKDARQQMKVNITFG